MKHNFRELNIWKKSIDLVVEVYQLISHLPTEEKFNLKSQIGRCSVSIPSNISEGSGRDSDKDFIRFIDYSLSSSYELETQLILTHRLFDINTEEIIINLNELQKMIGGFRKTLKPSSFES